MKPEVTSAATSYTDSGLTASSDTELRTALGAVGNQQFITITTDFSLTSVIDSAIINPAATDIQLKGNTAHTIGVTGNFRHFNISTSLTLSFDNITLIGLATLDSATGLVNGGSYGGGINIPAAVTSVTLNNPVITQVLANTNGAAIYSRSPLELNHAIITGNASDSYGAGLVFTNGADSVINDSIISNNTATIASGGIQVQYSSTLEINNSQITGNVSGNNGGGIVVTNNSNAIVSNCEISGNAAEGSIHGVGGGLYLGLNSTMTITDSRINDNTADGSYGAGGAIFTEFNNATLNVSSTEIIGNTASVDTGGIYVEEITGITIARDVIFADNSDATTTGDADVNWVVEKIFYNSNDGINRQFRTLFLSDAAGNFGTVSTKQFEHSNCTFENWNLLPAGTGTSFTAGTNLTTELQLYAIWKCIGAPGTGHFGSETSSSVSANPTVKITAAVLTSATIILFARKFSTRKFTL